MKIVHCCLANFYIDKYSYQENLIPKFHKLDGHDVLIIASTETFVGDNKLGYIETKKYVNEDGISVTRVPYRKILTEFLTRKIRSYKGVYSILEEEKPDIIFFHDTCAWELLNVVKYKKRNNYVKLFVDSHTDANNSATTFLSKNILHRIFYRNITRWACQHLEKILCVSLETKEFLNSIYGIPERKLEIYPLGGIVIEDEEYFNKRKRMRSKLGIEDGDILLVHSGKLDGNKRTKEILEALRKTESRKLRLAILGAISSEMKSIIEPMIGADRRVRFEGWKNGEELVDYLCAADMYVQPGTQSSTMQNAICCRCAVMLYPYRSHEPFLKGNGYFVKTVEDMVDCFKRICDHPELLRQMSANSLEIATDMLDYKKLAARIYQ